MAKIKALVKDPGKAPVIQKVENTLEALQELIGGNIECIQTGTLPGVLVLVDEEGKLKGLPQNFPLYERDVLVDQVVGRAVFVGTDREDFGDIPVIAAELIVKFMPIIKPEHWA